MEYCFQVPANRIGYEAGLSAAQLKTLQEVITLAVFVVFAAWYLREPIRWNVVAGFVFIAIGAALIYGPWARPTVATPGDSPAPLPAIEAAQPRTDLRAS